MLEGSGWHYKDELLSIENYNKMYIDRDGVVCEDVYIYKGDKDKLSEVINKKTEYMIENKDSGMITIDQVDEPFRIELGDYIALGYGGMDWVIYSEEDFKDNFTKISEKEKDNTDPDMLEISSLNLQMDELKKKLAEKNEDISGLKEKIEELEEDKTDDGNDYYELQKRNQELTKQLDRANKALVEVILTK
jgi:hypothetical protein